MSDSAVRATQRRAKDEGRVITINDGAGLTLEAQPSGTGWWRIRYWVDGRANRMSAGSYPDTTLAMARQKRNDARRGLAGGTDPVAAKRAKKAAVAAAREREKLLAEGKPLPDSFEYVAREWIDKIHRVKVSASHADRTLRRFEADVFPYIGRKVMDQVDAPELLKLLRRIEERGAIETAHRAKDSCGQVFRFGIATSRCSRNPAGDLKDALQPVVSTHLAAITDPVRTGALLRSIVDYRGTPVVRAALRLAPLVFQRPGELRKAEWAEFQLDEGVWEIPPERMKRDKKGKAHGISHLVPLPLQAVEILKDLRLLTGSGRYVFPGHRTTERPMSDNAVLSALRRMGYPKEEMSGHGFRAMARTMLAERLSVDEAVIDAQLAHAVKDANGRAYNRTVWLEQRRRMMQLWADYLEGLREAGDAALTRNAWPLRPMTAAQAVGATDQEASR
ncbi:tyrosine-type recombinase/integrase [Roseateles sp.]|uniref:tyrosine-type recombinase/integrase n=1 Tax=Roseateles sp. TaxID=1971397 RepID=UPI0039E8B649